MAGTEVDSLDASSVMAPIDITVRVWLDRKPELFANGLDPWVVCAALNDVLDSYVEYELTPAGEEEE